MVKILYCANNPLKSRTPFTFALNKVFLEATSSVKDFRKNEHPIVIINEDFLRRRKSFSLVSLKGKVCFVYFLNEDRSNVRVVKKYGFFDYFTGEDSKTEVMFKFERASSYAGLINTVKKHKDQLVKKDAKIEKMVLIDPLTGCYNWRYFLHRVHTELKRSRQHSYCVSFIGVDVDRFRQINELYGIRVADVVVKKLVKIFKVYLRDEDVISRWRGDEFFIIAPHLANKNAYTIAEAIRNKINNYKFKYKDLSVKVKVSIGVVSSPADNLFNIRDVIGGLNKCLINAKRKGGNSVMLCSSPQTQHLAQKKKKDTIVDLRSKIEKMDGLLTRDLLEMIYGFARAIEAKDAYTGEHVEYTAAIAEEIAKFLKLPRREVRNVKHAAVLHDLGKVGIDSRILLKKGRLTAREREIIKSHPVIASEILREIHVLREAIPAILYHHERYDGCGYPLGLKGEEIPLSARIVAVADVYQALISNRPYRKAFTKKNALELIKKESGTHFDPRITKIFFKVIKKINE